MTSTAPERFVPLVVRRRLALAPLLEPEVHTTWAAVLFVDLSNFTRLTESLSGEEGGAERLCLVLSVLFGDLIAIAHAHGGDVVKLCGDALIVVFDAVDSSTAESEALAARAAVAEKAAAAAYEAVVDATNTVGGSGARAVGVGGMDSGAGPGGDASGVAGDALSTEILTDIQLNAEAEAEAQANPGTDADADTGADASTDVIADEELRTSAQFDIDAAPTAEVARHCGGAARAAFRCAHALHRHRWQAGAGHRRGGRAQRQAQAQAAEQAQAQYHFAQQFAQQHGYAYTQQPGLHQQMQHQHSGGDARVDAWVEARLNRLRLKVGLGAGRLGLFFVRGGDGYGLLGNQVGADQDNSGAWGSGIGINVNPAGESEVDSDSLAIGVGEGTRWEVVVAGPALRGATKAEALAKPGASIATAAAWRAADMLPALLHPQRLQTAAPTSGHAALSTAPSSGDGHIGALSTATEEADSQTAWPKYWPAHLATEFSEGGVNGGAARAAGTRSGQVVFVAADGIARERTESERLAAMGINVDDDSYPDSASTDANKTTDTKAGLSSERPLACGLLPSDTFVELLPISDMDTAAEMAAMMDTEASEEADAATTSGCDAFLWRRRRHWHRCRLRRSRLRHLLAPCPPPPPPPPPLPPDAAATVAAFICRNIRSHVLHGFHSTLLASSRSASIMFVMAVGVEPIARSLTKTLMANGFGDKYDGTSLLSLPCGIDADTIAMDSQSAVRRALSNVAMPGASSAIDAAPSASAGTKSDGRGECAEQDKQYVAQQRSVGRGRSRGLQPLFARLTHELFAHGGVLRQFTTDDKGTVLIGVFAHSENDALLSVQAALAMRRAAAEASMPVGIGLCSGNVFAGEIGAPDRSDFVFVGDTVNMSARLAAAAAKSTASALESVLREYLLNNVALARKAQQEQKAALPRQEPNIGSAGKTSGAVSFGSLSFPGGLDGPAASLPVLCELPKAAISALSAADSVLLDEATCERAHAALRLQRAEARHAAGTSMHDADNEFADSDASLLLGFKSVGERPVKLKGRLGHVRVFAAKDPKDVQWQRQQQQEQIPKNKRKQVVGTLFGDIRPDDQKAGTTAGDIVEDKDKGDKKTQNASSNLPHAHSRADSYGGKSPAAGTRKRSTSLTLSLTLSPTFGPRSPSPLSPASPLLSPSSGSGRKRLLAVSGGGVGGNRGTGNNSASIRSLSSPHGTAVSAASTSPRSLTSSPKPGVLVEHSAFRPQYPGSFQLLHVSGGLAADSTGVDTSSAAVQSIRTAEYKARPQPPPPPPPPPKLQSHSPNVPSPLSKPLKGFDTPPPLELEATDVGQEKRSEQNCDDASTTPGASSEKGQRVVKDPWEQLQQQEQMRENDSCGDKVVAATAQAPKRAPTSPSKSPGGRAKAMGLRRRLSLSRRAEKAAASASASATVVATKVDCNTKTRPRPPLRITTRFDTQGQSTATNSPKSASPNSAKSMTATMLPATAASSHATSGAAAAFFVGRKRELAVLAHWLGLASARGKAAAAMRYMGSNRRMSFGLSAMNINGMSGVPIVSDKTANLGFGFGTGTLTDASMSAFASAYPGYRQEQHLAASHQIWQQLPSPQRFQPKSFLGFQTQGSPYLQSAPEGERQQLQFGAYAAYLTQQPPQNLQQQQQQQMHQAQQQARRQRQQQAQAQAQLPLHPRVALAGFTLRGAASATASDPQQVPAPIQHPMGANSHYLQQPSIVASHDGGVGLGFAGGSVGVQSTPTNNRGEGGDGSSSSVMGGGDGASIIMIEGGAGMGKTALARRAAAAAVMARTAASRRRRRAAAAAQRRAMQGQQRGRVSPSPLNSIDSKSPATSPAVPVASTSMEGSASCNDASALPPPDRMVVLSTTANTVHRRTPLHAWLPVADFCVFGGLVPACKPVALPSPPRLLLQAIANAAAMYNANSRQTQKAGSRSNRDTKASGSDICSSDDNDADHEGTKRSEVYLNLDNDVILDDVVLGFDHIEQDLKLDKLKVTEAAAAAATATEQAAAPSCGTGANPVPSQHTRADSSSSNLDADGSARRSATVLWTFADMLMCHARQCGWLLLAAADTNADTNADADAAVALEPDETGNSTHSHLVKLSKVKLGESGASKEVPLQEVLRRARVDERRAEIRAARAYVRESARRRAWVAAVRAARDALPLPLLNASLRTRFGWGTFGASSAMRGAPKSSPMSSPNHATQGEEVRKHEEEVRKHGEELGNKDKPAEQSKSIGLTPAQAEAASAATHAATAASQAAANGAGPSAVAATLRAEMVTVTYECWCDLQMPEQDNASNRTKKSRQSAQSHSDSGPTSMQQASVVDDEQANERQHHTYIKKLLCAAARHLSRADQLSSRVERGGMHLLRHRAARLPMHNAQSKLGSSDGEGTSASSTGHERHAAGSADSGWRSRRRPQLPRHHNLPSTSGVGLAACIALVLRLIAHALRRRLPLPMATARTSSISAPEQNKVARDRLHPDSSHISGHRQSPEPTTPLTPTISAAMAGMEHAHGMHASPGLGTDMRCAPKTDCSDGLEATGGLDDIDPRLCASSELLLLLEDFHNFDPGTWAMVGAARDWTGDSWNCLLGAAGGSAAAASATSEDANVQYIVAAAAAAAAAISIGDASAAAEADRPEPAASQQIGNAASAEAARWQQFGLWAAQYRVSSAQALSMGARSIGVPAAAAAAAAIAAGAAGAATTLALAPLTLAPLTLILTGRGFVQAPPLEYVALKFNDPCVQQLPLRNMKPADIVAVTAAFLGVRTMPSTSLEIPKQERYRRSLQGSRVRTGISVGHELNSPHSPTSPSHALQHSSTHVSWGSGQAARVRAQTRARNRKNTDSNNAGDSAEVAVADISTSLVALSRSACGSPALVRNVHEQQHDTRPRSFSMGGSKGDLGSPALSRTQSQSFSSNTKSASKMNSSGTNNDAHKLPRELVRFIVAKAEGNPRWATELALAALSAGAIRITRRRQRRHSSGGETAATSAPNSSTSAQNDIQILMAPEHVGAGTSDRGIRTPATPGGRTPGGSRRLAPRTPGGSRVSQLDGPVRLEDVPLLQQTLSSLFRSLVVEQLSPSVQLTLKVAAVVNVTGQFSLPVLYAVHPLRNEARSRRRARRQQMRLLQSVYRQRSTSNGVDSEDTGDDSDDEGSSTDEGSGSDADADIDTSFTAGVVGGGHGAATAAFGGNTSLPLAGVEGAIYADVIELERRRLVRESVSLSSKGEGSDNEDGGNGEGNDGNAGSAGLGPSDRIAPSLLGRGSRLRRLHESDAARFGQGLDAMGDIFEFVNDSLRQGVYDLLSLEQRRRFHGAIARHHIRACASSPQAMERLAAMAAAFGEKWTLVGLGLGVEPWKWGVDCTQDNEDSLASPSRLSSLDLPVPPLAAPHALASESWALCRAFIACAESASSCELIAYHLSRAGAGAGADATGAANAAAAATAVGSGMAPESPGGHSLETPNSGASAATSTRQMSPGGFSGYSSSPLRHQQMSQSPRLSHGRSPFSPVSGNLSSPFSPSPHGVRCQPKHWMGGSPSSGGKASAPVDAGTGRSASAVPSSPSVMSPTAMSVAASGAPLSSFSSASDRRCAVACMVVADAAAAVAACNQEPASIIRTASAPIDMPSAAAADAMLMTVRRRARRACLYYSRVEPRLVSSLFFERAAHLHMDPSAAMSAGAGDDLGVGVCFEPEPEPEPELEPESSPAVMTPQSHRSSQKSTPGSTPRNSVRGGTTPMTIAITPRTLSEPAESCAQAATPSRKAALGLNTSATKLSPAHAQLRTPVRKHDKWDVMSPLGLGTPAHARHTSKHTSTPNAGRLPVRGKSSDGHLEEESDDEEDATNRSRQRHLRRRQRAQRHYEQETMRRCRRARARWALVHTSMPVPSTLSVESSELALAALVKALRQAMRWREKAERDMRTAGLSLWRHGFQSSFHGRFQPSPKQLQPPTQPPIHAPVSPTMAPGSSSPVSNRSKAVTNSGRNNTVQNHAATVATSRRKLQDMPSPPPPPPPAPPQSHSATKRHGLDMTTLERVHTQNEEPPLSPSLRRVLQNSNHVELHTQNEEPSLSPSLRRVLRSVDSDAESSPASSPSDTRRRSVSVGQTNSVRLLRRASTSSVQSREDIEEREIEAAQAAARQFSASQAGARLEGNGAADTQLTSSSDDCHVLSDSSSDCDGSDSSYSEANANAGQNAALAEPNFQMKAVNYVLSQRVECDGRFSGWYRCREAELQRALDLVLIARATARQDAEAMAAALLRDSSFAAGGSGGGDCDSHKSQSNSAISTNDGNGKANEPVEGSVAPSESALPPLSESTVLRRRRSSSDLGAPPPLHTAAPGASMAFLSVDTRRAPIPSNAARQRRLPDDSPLSPTSPPAAPSLMLNQSPAEIRRTVAPASADHDVSGPGAHVVQSGGILSSAKSLGVRRFADATSGANKNVALAGAPAASPYLRRLRSDGDVPVDSAAGESNGQARTIVRRQRSEGDSAEPRDPGIVEHTVNDAEATRTGDLTVDEKRDQRRRVSAPEQRLLATLRHEDSMSLRRRLSAREAALVRAAVPRVQARLAMAAETDDVLETGDGKQRVSAMNIGKARAFGDRLTQRDRRHSISSLSSLAGVAGDDVVGADPLSGKRLTRADSIARQTLLSAEADLLCEAQPTTDWRHDSPRPKTSRNRSMRQRTIFSGGFSPRPGSPFGKNRSASSTKAAEIFSALLPEDHPENAEGGESQAPRRNSRSNRTGDRQNRDSIQSGRSDSIVSVASVNSVNSVASAMSSDADAPSLALNATSPNIKPSSPSQSKAGTGIQKLWKGIESGTNVQSHSDTSVRDQRIGDAKSSVIEPTSAQSKGAHDEMSSVSSEGERDVLGESDVEADEEISSAISAEALEQQQQQQQATPARLKRSLGRKVSFKEDTGTARNLVSEDSNDTSAADNDVLSSDDEDHDDDEDEDDDDALARTEAGRAMQVHAMARAIDVSTGVGIAAWVESDDDDEDEVQDGSEEDEEEWENQKHLDGSSDAAVVEHGLERVDSLASCTVDVTTVARSSPGTQAAAGRANDMDSAQSVVASSSTAKSDDSTPDVHEGDQERETNMFQEAWCRLRSIDLSPFLVSSVEHADFEQASARYAFGVLWNEKRHSRSLDELDEALKATIELHKAAAARKAALKRDAAIHGHQAPEPGEQSSSARDAIASVVRRFDSFVEGVHDAVATAQDVDGVDSSSGGNDTQSQKSDVLLPQTTEASSDSMTNQLLSTLSMAASPARRLTTLVAGAADAAAAAASGVVTGVTGVTEAAIGASVRQRSSSGGSASGDGGAAAPLSRENLEVLLGAEFRAS